MGRCQKQLGGRTRAYSAKLRDKLILPLYTRFQEEPYQNLLLGTNDSSEG